jgi:hypothetical protein
MNGFPGANQDLGEVADGFSFRLNQVQRDALSGPRADAGQPDEGRNKLGDGFREGQK